jgi:hypothetical protein
MVVGNHDRLKLWAAMVADIALAGDADAGDHPDWIFDGIEETHEVQEILTALAANVDKVLRVRVSGELLDAIYDDRAFSTVRPTTRLLQVLYRGINVRNRLAILRRLVVIRFIAVVVGDVVVARKIVASVDGKRVWQYLVFRNRTVCDVEPHRRLVSSKLCVLTRDR